ncbi:MAG: glycosyltransferase family A protein [Myxococcaceae bacterium]
MRRLSNVQALERSEVMRVSVVVPLYNKARWVRRSLDSIAAQSLRDFEVIVVNDGSTDGSEELVEQYPDPRFRLVNQQNAGPGAARNRGIAESRAPLVAFLDADDEWLPTYLERSVRLLERSGPEVAATTCCYYELPASVHRRELWRLRGVRDGLFRTQPDTPPSRLVHLLAFMSPWSTIARREVLDRYGGFFGRERCLYGEDAFLWLKVLLNETLVFSLEPLVRYHTEASALSRNLQGPRQVEPFLLYPEELELACPKRLKHVLREVLAIRAAKTACMLSWWGRWREARALVDRFAEDRPLREPWTLASRAFTNPVAALAARVCRETLVRARAGDHLAAPPTADSWAMRFPWASSLVPDDPVPVQTRQPAQTREPPANRRLEHEAQSTAWLGAEGAGP